MIKIFGNKNIKNDYLVSNFSISSLKKKKQNRKNEDTIKIDSENDLFIVADGMGGHRFPKFASSMATELTYMELSNLKNTLQSNPSIPNESILKTLEFSINLANTTMFNLANSYNIAQIVGDNISFIKARMKNKFGSLDKQDEIYFENIARNLDRFLYNEDLVTKLQGFGTTLDLAFIYKGNAYTAHVGNGRIIKVSGEGEISYHSKEHVESEGRNNISIDEWSVLESRCGIANYVGQGKDLKVDLSIIPLNKDDSLYLFTDGVTHTLSEKEILSKTKNFERSAKNIVNQTRKPNDLIDLYVNKGIYDSKKEAKSKLKGKDDASVLGIKICR